VDAQLRLPVDGIAYCGFPSAETSIRASQFTTQRLAVPCFHSSGPLSILRAVS